MSGYASGNINVINVLAPTESTDGVTAITSNYVKLDKHDKVGFMVNIGPSNAVTGGTTAFNSTSLQAIQLVSAYSATGGGSAVIGAYTTLGSTAASALTVTRANAVFIGLTSLTTAGNTWTINDVTFTSSSSGTSTAATAMAATRMIQNYPTPTAASANVTCEHLAAYINHPRFGCEGVAAWVNDAHVVVTTSSSNHLVVAGLGNTNVTAVLVGGAIVRPLGFTAYLETYGAEIANQNTSHKYVACTITPTTILNVSMTAIRTGGRYSLPATGVYTDYAVATT